MFALTLTLQDVLKATDAKSVAESVATVRSHFERSVDYSVPLPRINPGTKHFKYASLRMLGVPNAEACRIAEITIKTAENYRNDICKQARQRYGFEIEYPVVARDIVDYELALVSNRPVPERLIGKK